jgi:FlaA1/EpsC-like NDP-sugar epimerase
MTRTTGTRFLIIGAGDAGRMAAEEMLRHADSGLVPVGFIDDDPAKLGTTVAGLPVVGDRSRIHDAIASLAADEILIALPSASGSAVRGIIRWCESERVRFRVVPGIWEIIRGDVHLQQIRPVRAEDLLGRETVELDVDLVRGAYAGKRLLVTGAGGSIGSEICRQLLAAEPAELVLLGRGENSIFEADMSFRDREAAVDGASRRGASATRIDTVIGDVRDAALVERLVARVQPHAIFHAAAHKHVWLMEQHPAEAVANNVLATAGLIDAAVRHGAERFVLISTDKAVNPHAVMGATKRLAEIHLLQRAEALAAAGSRTKLMAVRFGNVLGSRGSVVPIFQRQIGWGGPVTVSHPEAARFFMTIKEAALLVIEAGAIGNGGEIFVLDMGEQVLIAELARDLIILSGLRPDVDVPIAFTGMKPGEKLREGLVHDFETLEATPVAGVRVTRGLKAGQPPVDAPALAELRRLADAADRDGILAAIERLVPEARLAREAPGRPAAR